MGELLFGVKVLLGSHDVLGVDLGVY